MNSNEKAIFISDYAKVVAAAWRDPHFAHRMETNPFDVLMDCGLTVPPNAKRVKIVPVMHAPGNIDQQIKAWEQGSVTGEYTLYLPKIRKTLPRFAEPSRPHHVTGSDPASHAMAPEFEGNHGRRRRPVHLVEFTALQAVRYSITLGYLHAAAVAEPTIKESCEFHKHVREQHEVESLFADLQETEQEPFVVALTVYFWNRQQSLKLARLVKERWPDCRIVIGGNDVSYQQDALFAEAPWVDVLVHGEGELRFRDVLDQFLAGSTDFSSIPGITYWAGAGEDRRPVTTAPPARITDLSDVPSPILTAVYPDEALMNSALIVYETNRGCPYRCAFCYWGGATKSKVRQFPMDRVAAELERIIRLVRPSTTLFIADANFGILGRDMEIAELIVELCRKYNKTIIVATNWAKNSNSRIVEIAATLHAAGLTGAITLSAQSFDDDVLSIANRANIPQARYRGLLDEFRELGIPTYTDLIWGLPGESLDSYLAGAEQVLSGGGSPVAYPLLLLNNTEYTKEYFRTEHELTVRRIPCDVTNPELVADVVVSHSRMSFDDWVRGMEFRVSLTLFQKILLRCAMRIMHVTSGVRLVDLCQLLLDYLNTCSDPYILAVIRNHGQAHRDPARVDFDLLHMALGNSPIPEELHYQAILHRIVSDPRRTREFVCGAIDYLCRRLTEQGTPADRALVDSVTSLDLAAAAVPRTTVTGVVENVTFEIPATAWKMLRDTGDVPELPWEPGGDLISGQATPPPKLSRYPLSVYAMSVWHGSGRPLHDLLMKLA
jgi:radical SAM superfamily enzyme YgiQ (UPF0313 family)